MIKENISKILIFILFFLLILFVLNQFIIVDKFPPPPGFTLKKSSEIILIDWALFRNGSLIILVKNYAGVEANLNLNETTAYLITSSLNNKTCISDVENAQLVIEPGKTTFIKFMCQIDPNIKVGDEYNINLSLDFIEPSNYTHYQTAGTIWGPLSG